MSDYLILVCNLGEDDQSLRDQEETDCLLTQMSKSPSLKSSLGLPVNSNLSCLIGLVTEISPNYSIKLNILAPDQELQLLQNPENK